MSVIVEVHTVEENIKSLPLGGFNANVAGRLDSRLVVATVQEGIEEKRLHD